MPKTVDTTLLDLDRDPTLEEMKAFFHKHDWSAAKLSEPSSRSEHKTVIMDHIKEIMDTEFRNAAYDKGLHIPSKYYDNKIEETVGKEKTTYQGNPLMELRDGTEDLISDAVYEIIMNHDDILDILDEQFDGDDPDLDKKSDSFLHNAVDTMLDVMDYKKIAELLGGMTAEEDFNHDIPNNFRKEDHERRWYHLDTKAPTLPDPEIEELAYSHDPGPEEQAISRIMADEFMRSLDEKDKRILELLTAGYTQSEIADTVGMSNNGGISKRLTKIRNEFIRKTGIKI